MGMFCGVRVFLGMLLLGNILIAKGKSISVFLEGTETFVINHEPLNRRLTRNAENPKESGNEYGWLSEQGKRLLKENDVLNRKPRMAGLDLSNLANEDWAVEWKESAQSDMDKYHEMMKVSREEIRLAQMEEVKDVLMYTGSVLGSAVLLIIFAVLFFRYPESFVCGCCFSYCCIKCCCPRLHTYMVNPQKYVHDRMNKYIPGMIIEEDGTVVHYEPTEEELDLLSQVIEQLMQP